MFGKPKINPYEEDLKQLIACMKEATSGKNAPVDVSLFHDAQVGEAFNALIRSNFTSNNVFVMRMNDAMKEIGDSSVVKNMIEEVNSQAGVVGSIHSSGEDLERSITNVQYAVQNIQKNSRDLTTTTQDCASEINESILTIEESSREVNEINTKLLDFRENAANITKIIDQIKDLADNSSLLALNASIEAARAGEAGRGFAIVAQQMGELSKNTTGCADSVVNYINELLSNLDILAGSVKETTRHLQQGTDNVSQSVKNMDKMAAKIDDMNANVDAIFEEINTQSALTEEFIALGNTVAGGFDRLNAECFTTGEHLFKISRRVDGVRSDMARGRAELLPLDWITVFEVDHLIFTWRQYNNLVGFEHLKIEQVNNPKGCKLGKWLAAQTDKRITGSAAFKQTYDRHNDLHRHAVNCFNASAKGDREEALAHFERAYDSYKQLMGALGDLRRVMRSAGYTEETNISK
ncbi:MAG: chemotaxis protein [Lachnospiraceae bacterium]|nr:chemotaxis protein [Lachnospiraceae bacterium]